MNQTFKKKAIAASVAMVFAVGATGVLANAFEAASFPTSTSYTKAVTSTVTPVAVTVPTIDIQELGVAGVTDGYVTIRIPSSVDLVDTTAAAAISRDTTNLGSSTTPKDISVKHVSDAGTATTNNNTTLNVGTSGTVTLNSSGNVIVRDDATASNSLVTNAYYGASNSGYMEMGTWASLTSVTGAGSAYTKVGQMYLDTSADQIVITLAIKGNASAAEIMRLAGLQLKPRATNATGTVTLSFSDGKADGTVTTGMGSGSLDVITMSSQAVTLTGTASTATIPTITAGAVGAQPTGVMSFTTIGASANANNVITIALDNGAKFHSGATAALQAALTVTGAGQLQTDLRTSANSASIAVDSQGRLVLTLGTTDWAAAEVIAIPVSTAVIDTSAVTGAVTITATATGSGTDISTLSATTSVATTAARATTVTWVDDTTTGYTKIYAGRTAQTIAEKVRLGEAAPASLLSGGSITMTLDKGAKFTTSDNIAATEWTTSPYADTTLAIAAITAPSTAGATASGATTAASSGSLGAYDFDSFSFDLTSATAGDLTLTFAGTASATGSAKVAEIIDATSVSVSGTMPTLVPGGAAATLPDIVITEAKYGALAVGVMGLRLPTGVTYEVGTAPTITVTNSAGSTLSSKVTTPATTHYVASAGAVAASTYEIGVTVVSDNTTGPYTIKISGLKAKASTTAASGSTGILLHGTTDGTLADVTVATTADETSSASNVGAKPRSTTVTVGSVVGATVPSYPAATVTGVNTAQTISTSVVPAGNDQGKQGSTFLILHAPSGKFGLTADYYFTMSSTGTFSLMTGCSDAVPYSTGALASTTMPVVSTASNLSSLVGLEIIVGYGVGGGLTSGSSTACTNMLSNGTWGVSYTIQ